MTVPVLQVAPATVWFVGVAAFLTRCVLATVVQLNAHNLEDKPRNPYNFMRITYKTTAKLVRWHAEPRVGDLTSSKNLGLSRSEINAHDQQVASNIMPYIIVCGCMYKWYEPGNKPVVTAETAKV